MSIGQTNKNTIVEAYKSCRAICTEWIHENHEPLGVFGEIVEFDESFCAGQPKYGRGRAVAQIDTDPWVFGLAQRGSLDCWLEQVHNRRRNTFVPLYALASGQHTKIQRIILLLKTALGTPRIISKILWMQKQEHTFKLW